MENIIKDSTPSFYPRQVSLGLNIQEAMEASKVAGTVKFDILLTEIWHESRLPIDKENVVINLPGRRISGLRNLNSDPECSQYLKLSAELEVIRLPSSTWSLN